MPLTTNELRKKLADQYREMCRIQREIGEASWAAIAELERRRHASVEFEFEAERDKKAAFEMMMQRYEDKAHLAR